MITTRSTRDKQARLDEFSIPMYGRMNGLRLSLMAVIDNIDRIVKSYTRGLGDGQRTFGTASNVSTDTVLLGIKTNKTTLLRTKLNNYYNNAGTLTFNIR